MLRKLFAAAVPVIVLVTLTSDAFAQASVRLVFLRGNEAYAVWRQVNEQPSPELAARLLVAGPDPEEYAQGLTTAIPSGWTIESSKIVEDTFVIGLGGVTPGVHYSDEVVDNIVEQFSWTIRQFGGMGVRLIIGTETISVLRYPQPDVGHRPETPEAVVPAAAGKLVGKKICLSPGHGYIWTGSAWYTQRSVYCAPLSEEDFHNIDHAILLKTYLEAEGATVVETRELDKNRGNSPYANHPWWQMCGGPYLYDQGYPMSVYAPVSSAIPGTPGVDQSLDDRRTRPLACNYDGGDLYISLHTNGLHGDCTGTGCPTGMDMYYDSSKAGSTGNDSRTLAAACQTNCSNAVHTYFNSSFLCRNGCTPLDNNFAEIHYPTAPACLLEFGFHDTCDKDAVYLRDPLFTSAGMYGMYKGICQYFGVTPTYDGYSAEYVSDDIPTSVVLGETRTVHITFRNHGVAWSENHQFRLGAVGDSDPFECPIRQTLAGVVGPGETYTFTFDMTFVTLGNQVTDWRMTRDGVTWFGDTLSKMVYVAPNNDTEPPTVPQNLRVSGSSLSSVSLAWDPSTDDIGVYRYEVYRDGSLVATIPATSYTDFGRTRNSAYEYHVAACDLAGNCSDLSPGCIGMTTAGVFNEPFVDDLSSWMLDPEIAANAAMDYVTNVNHGALAGFGSAFAQAGSPRLMYHWLDSGNQSITGGGYRTGEYSGWFDDPQGTGGGPAMRTGFSLYAYNDSGTVEAVYWVGVNGDNPPNMPDRYLAGVWAGGWTYYDLGARSAGWHRCGIRVLPYSGSDDVEFLLDGAVQASASQPSAAIGTVFRRAYIGSDADVGVDHHFDDITFDSTAPAAPTGLSGVGISDSVIRWSFTDNANNEIGCRVYSGSVKTAEREVVDAAYVDESGLLPNTIYTRTVKAYAGILESASSNTATSCTLSKPPSTSTVTCDKPTGAWQTESAFVFTAVGGFGAGKLAYYSYAWDQQPSHSWTGFEWTWAAGVMTQNASASADPWYLHVQGYNMYGLANGTLDLGPYYCDDTSPTGLVCSDNGQHTMSTTSLKAVLSGAADPESGVTAYRVSVGSTPGGTDVTGGWVDVGDNTNPTISGLSLAVGSVYYVSAQARNAAGSWSSTATSDGITVISPTGPIAAALSKAPGVVVGLKGKIVTDASADGGVIEEPDRSAALGVQGSGLTAGSTVDVIGTMGASTAPRNLMLLSIDSQSAGGEVKPVGIRLKDLGGTDFGVYSPGAALGMGLYNVSLLVRVCGIVTGHDDVSFTIDDGSLADDGSGTLGVRILSGSLHRPADGSFAVVTGISSVIPETGIRAVVPRTDADITP